ncbi:MAG: hypothetical protein LJE62_04025 [Silicimonas sp.]|nr:hypothetical protein [Silicimonas sp.]
MNDPLVAAAEGSRILVFFKVNASTERQSLDLTAVRVEPNRVVAQLSCLVEQGLAELPPKSRSRKLDLTKIRVISPSFPQCGLSMASPPGRHTGNARKPSPRGGKQTL